MKKKYLILISLTLLFLASCTATGNITPNHDYDSLKEINIDQLEIIHFHGTHQCYSCIIVGDYAKETVETHFKEELAQGIITFKHVNGDLPENKDLVIKYGATGSSLWLGTYTEGKFLAEQNTNVWYRINNKQSYTDYLKGVIEQKLAGN